QNQTQNRVFWHLLGRLKWRDGASHVQFQLRGLPESNNPGKPSKAQCSRSRALTPMNLLYRYSKQYWKLFVAALLLAATNQIFSLLDPLIFRHVVDSYATKYHQYTQGQFIRGAGLLLLAAVGVAFVSRVAKNFQDYFVNVIVQRLGAKMYTDGIRHSLDLPYQVFEDQRSGETLGKLQKVRSDV